MSDLYREKVETINLYVVGILIRKLIDWTVITILKVSKSPSHISIFNMYVLTSAKTSKANEAWRQLIFTELKFQWIKRVRCLTSFSVSVKFQSPVCPNPIWRKFPTLVSFHSWSLPLETCKNRLRYIGIVSLGTCNIYRSGSRLGIVILIRQSRKMAQYLTLSDLQQILNE